MGATLADFIGSTRLADSLVNGLSGSAYVHAHGLATEAYDLGRTGG
jgi:hypothetical protein